MRILVATDAWHPQVNGVVRTLTMMAEAARPLGAALTISPQACLAFAAKHSWEASARALSIMSTMSARRIADEPVQFAVKAPRLTADPVQAPCPGAGAGVTLHDDNRHPACDFRRHRCRRARAGAVRGANPAAVAAGSLRTHGNQDIPETGNAAADRIVQVPRRLQQAVVDPDGGARRRRGGVFVRQPRPGRGACGADPGHAGHHRDAL